jgi:hypothetical protein
MRGMRCYIEVIGTQHTEENTMNYVMTAALALTVIGLLVGAALGF